jgi:catechol 2,3-dioxygenase-like lactoylglutathione lyase family enzyme
MTASEPRLAWGHINLNVSDLDRSIEFYEKLGFSVLIPGIPYLNLEAGGLAQEIPDPSAHALGLPVGTRARACIMQLGDGFPKIDLIEFADQTPRPPPTNLDLGLVRICLASRDLHKDFIRLRGRGVEFISEPQPCKDRMADVATCIDPDGTLIELLQVYLDRWPQVGRVGNP